MTKPTLMAVDGNSLLHRAYHAMASTGLRDRYGRPTWALKGMLSLIGSAVERVGADALVVGFDSPGDSVRRGWYPDYKGTRSEKDPDLVAQLELAPRMLAYAGIAVVTVPGLEADDVTATAARVGGEAGWHTVIVTSDRDSFAHISEHTSVLRILNGGVDASPVLTPDRIVTMTGIGPHQYLDYAALRGDTSDNLPGVNGIGEKTAAKLLNAFGSMTAVWDDLRNNNGDRIASDVGKAVRTRLLADGAYDAWERNVKIMSAFTDVDLGVDLAAGTGHGHLPLDPGPLTEACKVVSFDATLPMLMRTLSRSGPRPAPVTAPAPAPREETLAYVGSPAGDSRETWVPSDADVPPLDEDYYAAAAAAQPVVATANGLHPAAAVDVLF